MASSLPIPIAIIGIGCRLPGDICDTESFWSVLLSGKNTWSPVPPERFNEAAFYHPNPANDGTTNHRGGHFLSQDNDLAAFDAHFFGMSVAEAQATDPQQRLLLEISYEAFENAGIPVERIRGSDTAVFTAMFTRDYDRIVYKDPSQIPRYQTTGCGEAIVSNRISHFFDLTGPSVTLDTGCSGSLVALHQACQSLRIGESSIALACGVNLILSPDQMIGMSNLYMLNENGRSYPFDSRGSGYGRGEGAAVVILKRLDNALEAGDNIRGIIRNTAVNHDGNTNGITFPSHQAQETLQRSCYGMARLDPYTVQYVEAHGTGTMAGDLAELQGISQVFGKDRTLQNPIYVGSVKSNIGHLESSSGLAGLIKTVLMLEKGCILPNADFQDPKHNIKLDEWRIKIPQKLEHWPDLWRASVNGFGYGGVNAHVIVERARARQPTSICDYQTPDDPVLTCSKAPVTVGCSKISDINTAPQVTGSAIMLYPLPRSCHRQLSDHESSTNHPESAPHHGIDSKLMANSNTRRLFTMTAVTKGQMLETAKRLLFWTSAQSDSSINLESLAYTLSARRSVHQWRYTFQADSRSELLSLLSREITPTKSSKALKILFVFTGQGAQWYAMGRELNARFQIYQDSLLRSDAILRDLGASWSLVHELGREEQESRVHQSEIAQPSSTALQIALVDLLASFDVKPAAVIGHSSGEIAAAYAAGVVNHRTALKISFLRSLLLPLYKKKWSAKGAMLSVGLGEKDVSPFLEQIVNGIASLACVNSLYSTTVSGDETAITELQSKLNAIGVFNRKLKVDTAYHSHHMRKVAQNYLYSLGNIDTDAVKNELLFISTVTGMQKDSGFGSDYWVENLVSKVRFSEALDEYCGLGLASSHTKRARHVCIEIGPHGTLGGPIQQTLRETPSSLDWTYLTTLTRGQNAIQGILSLSGRLFDHGRSINIQAVNCLSESKSSFDVLPNLPTYPWDHSRAYWHESRLSKDYRFRQHACHDLLGVKVPSSPDLEPSWQYIVSLDSLPWLADHAIDGLVTFPGASYLCMAIEAFKQIVIKNGIDTRCFVLKNVHFLKALVVPPAPEKVELQLCFRSEWLTGALWYDFRVYAISQDSVCHEHCRGRISASAHEWEKPQKSNLTIPGTHLAGSRKLNASEVYSQLRSNGNAYGPRFARIKELHMTDSQAACQIAIPDIHSTMPAKFQQPHIIHPTTLDALLHTAVLLYGHYCGSGSVMPVAIEELSISLQISSAPGDVLDAALKLFPNGVRSAFANFSVSTAGKNAKRQPLLVVSNMQLLGVGETRESCQGSSQRLNIGHRFQWIPRVISKDFEEPSILTLQIWKSPAKDKASLGRDIEIITAQRFGEFATVLASVLGRDHQVVKSTTWGSQITNSEAVYLILDDSKEPFLESPSSELFRHITSTINSIFIIVCVSVQAGSVGVGSSADPKNALITGFARSARAEREQLRFAVLDVQNDVSTNLMDTSCALSEILCDVLTRGDELEYAYRDGQILVPRLVPDPHLNKYLERAGQPQMDEIPYLTSNWPLKLDFGSIQPPESLNFVKDCHALEPLKLNEVLIEASAHSLSLTHGTRVTENFIDSMPVIRGFAGKVIAVGSESQSVVKMGDAVMGWNLNSPAYVNNARAKAHNTTPIPGHWSLSSATAMIVPLMLGYHSLFNVAKLQRNQSVLVHGAADIYRHCAIEMAKSAGATVFATVTTAAEQVELANRFNLPPSHLLYDRGMTLKGKVLELTAENGMDVVLTMPCEVLPPELGDCVAVLGVYVQALRGGTAAQVSPPKFPRHAITFASFDLETIALHRPEVLAKVLDKAVSMVPSGAAPFMDVKNIPLLQMEDALAESRALRTPESIVLTANMETRVRVPFNTGAASRKSVSGLLPDAAYVVAGGLGDLGQKIFASMAKIGAAHIVLLSRRFLSQETVDDFQETLRQEAPGLKLYAFQCDISERTTVKNLAVSLKKLMLPPIRGIIQSATVLHDRVLERMTTEDWQIPLQAKLYGTRNLNEMFGSPSLDFFIMLSSLSGVVGTRGQANYAAGNTYQDAFAQCNVQCGTAYIALDLGMIEESSAYQKKAGQIRAQNLLRQGWIPIKSEQFIAILEWVLSPETWQRGSAQYSIGIDGASILEAENPTPTTRSAMFSQVRDTCAVEVAPTNKRPSDQRPDLEAVDNPTDALKIIADFTSQKISSLISVGEEKVNQDIPLQDLGLDSLAAIEIKNFVGKEFDATIHASEILDEPSLTALSSKVVSRSETLQKRFGDPLGHAKTIEEGGNRRASSARASPAMLTNGVDDLSTKGGLPALPLPNVEDTIDLYLTSTKPFLDVKNFERTFQAAKIFKCESGRFLQNKLEIRLRTQEAEGWQHDLQASGIYLRRRSPILPFGTFYGVHLLTDSPHSQAERAAMIAKAAYAFKKKLEANELQRDYLNDEPLCADSLDWLFNAYREPVRIMDMMRKHESSNYMIALCRGHAFRVALEEGVQAVPHTKLRGAFENILDTSRDELPSIAALTADERNSWAELRGTLKISSVTNNETLGTIEAAAFVVCLDETSPTTPTERCNPLLLGDPGNRWSDKTLQFVVYANGTSGYICEHSMLDAASLRQMNEFIATAIAESTPTAELKGFEHGSSNVLKELKFDVNDLLLNNIDRVQEHVRLSYSPIEFVRYTLPSMGRDFFRHHKMPSKAGIQAIIQLASRLYYGVQYPSWETLTMMPFRYGRLDWMQSVSPAMFAFCEAAFEESLDLAQRSKLLREAAGTHTSTMTRISRGRGFAAHLEALWEIAQQEGVSVDFIEDPAWEMMRVTSTRKLKTDASQGLMVQEAGFFMPDPESVFVHYEVEESECCLFVQSTEGRTSKFCEALERAAEHIKRLLNVE